LIKVKTLFDSSSVIVYIGDFAGLEVLTSPSNPASFVLLKNANI
jgi:hypothetical protein